MAPTPEWFLGLLLTHVVPVVLLFALAGTVLGALWLLLKRSLRRSTASGERTPRP